MKEEEKEVQLSNEFFLRKSNGCFVLDWRDSVGHIAENGKKKGEHVFGKKTRYYGTLYQALQGFLGHYVELEFESMGSVTKKIEEVMGLIEKATKKIEDDWKIVKVVKG
jgi:hypothetical protein